MARAEYEALAEQYEAEAQLYRSAIEKGPRGNTRIHKMLRECEVIAQALRTAVKPVAIKALEWKFFRDGFPPYWYADVLFGSYLIEETDQGGVPGYSLFCPWFRLEIEFEALDYAKAAAQADFEQRIRSALATPAA